MTANAKPTPPYNEANRPPEEELPKTISSLLQALEMLIDSQGLEDTLGRMASICKLKAKTERDTWNDEMEARKWDNRAKEVIQCAKAVRKLK